MTEDRLESSSIPMPRMDHNSPLTPEVLEIVRLMTSEPYLEFVFEMEPVPAGRPRSDGRGRMYTPENYKVYKDALAMALKAAFGYYAWDIPAPGSKERAKYLKNNPLGLSLQVYRSKDTGDLDNFTKAVKDALGDAGIIANDKQIVEYLPPFRMRVDKARPRVEIRLWRMTL